MYKMHLFPVFFTHPHTWLPPVLAPVGLLQVTRPHSIFHHIWASASIFKWTGILTSPNGILFTSQELWARG